ncbi:uncharacterized protein PITG_01230 [Phytophthora infestans T30-4]|uniref:Uncharacterized protein n=1 Tax=Phytophthora infestans (strain T30-4) TaxID=403677 RepID=D0MUZ0_PHYIT|nr:uncharacterized protein PITG_01230 [Phytophthora infestans T30-4]EEY60986.1 hypothetical protein PITG_01230 [Phytophthora infestans T30-4]|eukprot:XP_002907903.1 hypothetical protein PITG_01230 [Phytophthora infestans T30-4]
MLESDSSSSSSSDSDENIATEATTWRDVESCEVQLQVSDVERTLLIKSRTEAGAVLARLRRRMFGSSSSGRASVGDLLCEEIGFVEGTSIASLDDDMIRLRSHLVDDVGLTHVRNPKKGLDS